MRDINIFVSLKERLIIYLICIGVLFFINYLLFGSFLPQFNYKGLWFLCCFLNIILANQLLTPYFSKPVDSISYSITCLVSIIMIRPESTWNMMSCFLYYLIIVYTILIIIIAIVYIIFKDLKNDLFQNAIEKIKIIVTILGNAKVIFSMAFFFSLLTFHLNNSREILVICLAYLLFIIQSPINSFYLLIKKLFRSNKILNNLLDFGEILTYQEPNIILVRQQRENNIPYMSGIIFKDLYSIPKFGFSLDYIGKANGVLLRSIIFGKANNKQIIRDIKELPENSAIFVTRDYLIENKIKFIGDEIIGIVTNETTNEYMWFEIIKDDDIEVGTLVYTNIQNKKVIFQIINGKTKDEIIYNKNTRGFINVITRKIGEWDNKKHRFIPNNWLPKINAPVMKCFDCNRNIKKSIPVGHFPYSNFTVHIDDINSLVTHNTAILGVLGVGKSMLAIELAERLISQNIKVIVLDLTNQYKSELSYFIDEEYEEKCLNKLLKASEEDRDTWDENVDRGGSIKNFTEALYRDIYDLVNNNNNRNLKIYNPAQLFVTKQNNEPKSYNNNTGWNRTAQLYTLTPVEITKLVSEVTLSILSDEMRDTAKLCLIFEEAHSLIPEFSSIVVETDKCATNGTARAILQGRKYGLGCIVITQRTANVTKTILNQCNSIFAMRTFDDTGKDFLSNYIGSGYTNILSSLKERQAVYFGKSSSCENPVLIRLNDRKIFLQEYRKKNPIKEIIKDEEAIDDLSGDLSF